MGTDSKEYKMAIKIAGNIDASFYKTMKTAQKQLNAMRPGFETLENVSTTALKAMAAASATAAAAVGGITAASINVGSEFESAFAGVRKTVNATEQEFSQMEEAIRNMSLGMVTVQERLGRQDFLDADTRDAISELLGLMEGTMDQIETTQEEYRSQGKGIPENLMDAINDEAMLRVLVGQDRDFFTTRNGPDVLWEESVNKYVGKQIENNREYQGIADDLAEEPYTAGIAKAIQDNASIVYDATDELYQGVKGYTEEIFNAGFDVETPVNIKLKAVYDNTNLAQIPSAPEGYAAFAEYPVNLGGHKDGGIFDVPHIAWFAEDGPEAAIPLDGSRNAVELWEKTGQLLGLNPYTDDSNSIPSLLRKLDSIEVTADNSTNVEFKPELHFHGGTPDKADLEGAFDTSYDKFEAMLEKYFREKRRLSLN